MSAVGSIAGDASNVLSQLSAQAAQRVQAAKAAAAQATAAAQSSATSAQSGYAAAQALALTPQTATTQAATIQAAATQAVADPTAISTDSVTTAVNQVSAAGGVTAVNAISGIAPNTPSVLSTSVLSTLIADQAGQPKAAPPADAGLATVTDGSDPKTVFLNYMKETPAQQMEDSWLSSHHLTSKQLAAMPPAERDAIEKRMQAEIKERITQSSENKLKAKSLTA